jgi:predicted CxxxxCH...CXXCH cytochrome family protein
MRTSRLKTVLFILSAVTVLMVGGAAYGIDPPHIAQPPFNVGCGSCHGTSFGQGGTIEDTPLNNLCRSCHDGVAAPVAAPHSSITTGSNNRNNWSYDCIACHDPHSQRQPRMYAGSYPGGSALDERTILSIDQGNGGISNIITVSGTPWQPDQWKGFYVKPDKGLDLYYYIIDSDISNLVVGPELDVSNFFGIWPGDTLNIMLSKLVKEEIAPGFAIVNGSGATLEGGFARPVQLFNSVGQHSRAEDGNDQQAICVVCHTKTAANNYAITKWRLQYVDQNELDEYDTAALNHTQGDDTCASCHLPHESGFQSPADCLVVSIKQGGTAVPWSTGSQSIGAHTVHAGSGAGNRAGLDCYECHNPKGLEANGTAAQGDAGMFPVNASVPDIGDNSIWMGFNVRLRNATDPLLQNSGAYDGRLDSGGGDQLLNGYIYNGYSLPGAPGPGGGTKQCSTVYCHSDGGGLGDATVFRTPTWSNSGAAALTCAGCHGAGTQSTARADFVVTDTHPKHRRHGPELRV